MTAKITPSLVVANSLAVHVLGRFLLFFMYSKNSFKHAVTIRGLFAVDLFQYVSIQGRGVTDCFSF